MRKSALIIISILFFSHCLLAETIKGRVTDSKTNEPVTGAVVSIGDGHKEVLTGLDGSFEIKEVHAGKYTLTVKSISYAAYSQELTIDGKTDLPSLSIVLNSETKSLSDIVVVGGRRTGTTDASARQLEKSSDNVINILSTHQLQLAPDVTVANVLRRVSGVTVDRGDDGEGRYPVIRGMDKRYNYTLINGIKIPSPDDKNRYVPMDMFPSEMLQRLEVIKSLTPDMEGDAIGGVMNLVMKDAPEHLQVNAQAALGYSQMLLNESFTSYDHSVVNLKAPVEIFGNNYVPTFSNFSTQNVVFTQGHPLPDGQLGFTIGNRFLNQRLGIIFSGSVQSTDRMSKDHFFDFSPQPTPGLYSTLPAATDEEYRTYSTHEDRIGLHAKLDYRLGEHSHISFYTVFIQLNNYKSRQITDSTDASGRATFGPGYGEVDYSYRSESNFQSIYNATLQGLHTIKKNWFVDWSIAYSQAGQKQPDQATFTNLHVFIPDSTTATVVHDLERTWQHNSDQDIAGYLNIHHKFTFKGQSFDIGAGAMYRHKERTNYYYDYDFIPPSTDTFTTVQNAFSSTLNPSKAITQSINTYSSTEDITAGYSEIRWLPNKKWNVLAGVRFENTNQTYNQVLLPISAYYKMGAYGYLDPLPSMQIKYKLSDKAALHLAYFSSITRPGFFEVVPTDKVGEYYNEDGNDSLKHTTANNIDLRYELFPGVADQLLIGVFYKNIQNPIEYVYERFVVSESIVRPENVGAATNIGAEVVYTHYFNKFGISANYTYTHSNVSTSYKYLYQDSVVGTTYRYIPKNRPLQGQAAHIGNLSLLYKDPKPGLELQLSTIYTGRHITYLSQYGSPDATMDYWQRGTLIEDFSGEKSLGKHFSIYTKINNLLNTPDIIEMMFPSASVKTVFADAAMRSDRILIEKKYFGQTYLLGIRYHF
jgi:outer membrane receptor protein involved in Fe transport